VAEIKSDVQSKQKTYDTGKTDTKVVGDSNDQLEKGRERGAEMSRERGTNLSPNPVPPTPDNK